LELPHDSSSLKSSAYFATKAKKNGKVVLDYFAVYGHYFADDLAINLP